ARCVSSARRDLRGGRGAILVPTATIAHAPRVLIVGETPPRSAKPATLLWKPLITIEARDPVPAPLHEGFGQHALGHLVCLRLGCSMWPYSCMLSAGLIHGRRRQAGSENGATASAAGRSPRVTACTGRD